jgi:hypothetical protein
VESEETNRPEDYTDKVPEMINRAPHGTRVYKLDNAKVHDIMREICDSTPEAKVTIRVVQLERNGRNAYFLLYARFMGKNSAVTRASTALRILEN